MKERSIDFSKFSSIKIGPIVKVSVIEKGDKIPKDRLLIGHANNLLISPTPPKLMLLGKDFNYVEIKNKHLIIGASTPTGRILSFCKRFDIGGFEFVAKLPGTLGGMLAMNAGVKSYEIFNSLLEVKTNIGTFAKNQIDYGYRYAKLPGIALEGRFKFQKGFDKALASWLLQLRKNQPQLPSAGSTFKNPPNDYAGRLIEAVGLKGKRIGDMAWSDKHANFLINLGGGTFDEAIKLIELAKERVFKRYGIKLELEIKLI